MPPAHKPKLVATIGSSTRNPDASHRVEVMRMGEQQESM
jgi:hypothetical protein